MVLTHEQISGLKPMNNHVLIKLSRKKDEIKTPGGGKLYIDPTFEEEKHFPVTGYVIARPRSLFYSDKIGDSHSMPWKTDIEIKEGDYVIFYYMAVLNCMGTLDQPGGNGKYFKDPDGGEYIMITYDNLFVAKRDDKIIPLNGYLLLEAVEDYEYRYQKERFDKMGLTLPPNYTQAFSKEGVVKFIGTPNRDYRDRNRSGDKYHTDEGIDIERGMKLIIRKAADIPLEYEYHASLEGRKKFLRVQRRYILYAEYE